MFLKSIKTRLQNKKVCESMTVRDKHFDKDWEKLPTGWNVSIPYMCTYTYVYNMLYTLYIIKVNNI
jgi:hypothetical protein